MIKKVLEKSLLRPLAYRFASEVQPTKAAVPAQQAQQIQQYRDGQLVVRNFLQLKKKDDITNYVVGIVKNYYRTTNKVATTPLLISKANLQLESELTDHGLDSLDCIELSMQVRIQTSSIPPPRSKKTLAT